MDKVCLFVICMYCSIHHLSAQQEEQQTQPVQQPLVTQDDILGNMNGGLCEDKAASVKCPL